MATRREARASGQAAAEAVLATWVERARAKAKAGERAREERVLARRIRRRYRP
jgi:hypothetical protein